MTDTFPEGLQAAADRVQRARENFARFSMNLERDIERLESGDVSPKALGKDPKVTGRQYEAALTYLHEQEAEFVKQCEAITGVINGDALDLAEAKQEILGRVTRLRERSGG